MTIPDAEYKTMRNKSLVSMKLTPNTVIGQIDKVDDKINNRHNIYNLHSKCSLVSGIFEANSLEPIIVFHIGHKLFQERVYELIQERNEIYMQAQREVDEINKKIEAKDLKAGDTVKLSHLKKDVILKARDGGTEPLVKQIPRDSLSLTLGDFLNKSRYQSVQIIYLNPAWKEFITYDDTLLSDPYFQAEMSGNGLVKTFDVVLRDDKLRHKSKPLLKR